MSHTYYLQQAFQHTHRKDAIEDAVFALSKHRKCFETIVVTGLSGTLIGPTVAYLMGKDLGVVRQRKSKHCDFKLEATKPIKNYIIIDDMVDTGDTIKKIIKDVDSFYPNAILYGVYCYQSNNPRPMSLWQNVPCIGYNGDLYIKGEFQCGY